MIFLLGLGKNSRIILKNFKYLEEYSIEAECSAIKERSISIYISIFVLC